MPENTKIAYLRENTKSIASVGLNHVTDMSQDDMDVVGNIGLEVSLDVQHSFFAKFAKFLDFDLLPLWIDDICGNIHVAIVPLDCPSFFIVLSLKWLDSVSIIQFPKWPNFQFSWKMEFENHSNNQISISYFPQWPHSVAIFWTKKISCPISGVWRAPRTGRIRRICNCKERADYWDIAFEGEFSVNVNLLTHH